MQAFFWGGKAGGAGDPHMRTCDEIMQDPEMPAGPVSPNGSFDEDESSAHRVLMYNESRYCNLLALWPEGTKSDASDMEQRAASDIFRRVRSVDEGVRDVLRKHLAAFERGHITLDEAYDVVRRFEGGRWDFRPGDVVEWRGGDMRWRLGMIIESRDRCWSVFSPSGVHICFDDEADPDAPRPRPSNKVLRVVFGPMPFRWQQHQLLQAEEAMVHRRCSPLDFQNVEWTLWARRRWHHWLEESDFGAYYRVQHAGARRALESLVLEPFRLIDEINMVWKFNRAVLTPYQYLACLGSGTNMALICLTIQLGAALSLWRFHAAYDDEEEDRKEWADSEGLLPCRIKGDRGPILGRWMITLVTLFYLVKVVPDALSAALRITAWRHDRFVIIGRAKASSAEGHRLASLRRHIRTTDKDTLKMMLGLRLHETMNTAFDSLLYILNLYILFGTRSVLEILLNCVAVEWIRGIDESFCASTWWDPDSRYIKAAAVEMVFRQFLDVRSLENRWKALDHMLSSESPPAESDRRRPSGQDSGQRESIVRSVKLSQSAVSSLSNPSKRWISQRRENNEEGGKEDEEAMLSEFVVSKLHFELDRFYGDDLKSVPKASRSWWKTCPTIRGANSWMLGRYKRLVFRRWEKFLDGTIDWTEETMARFETGDHAQKMSYNSRTIRIVYGVVPGFPRAFFSLTSSARYTIACFLHKYPAFSNLIAAACGFKLYRAFRYQNPYSGFPYAAPDSRLERLLRHLATIVDAVVEFVSIWVVIVFPLVICVALVYFPLCY